jgi:hypothetical protein
VRQERSPREREHECQQIHRQRHDPEERNRGYVGREVGRHAQHQAGGDGGKRDPAESARERQRLEDVDHRLRDRIDCGGRQRRTLAPGDDAGDGHHQPEEDVAGGPGRALQGQRHRRLDEGRIREQRQQAAGVAGGVEEVGIVRLRMPRPAQPSLQQRRGRGDRNEGRADADQQQPEQPSRGGVDLGRRRAGGNADRQDEQAGQHHHQEMERDLQPERQARDQMGVEIAAKQRQLEEDEAGIPDGRRPPEQRQHQLAHLRLHGEHEKRTKADRDRKQNRHCS